MRRDLGIDRLHRGHIPEHDHEQHHDGHHHHGSKLSEVELRVRALETVLTEKGYVDPAALDRIVEAYETRIGPHIGRPQLLAIGSIPCSARRCWLMPPRRSRTRASRPIRRSSDRCREHPIPAQHRRLHVVLLLPLGGARLAARLI
jgi:hypothetical protein